MKKSKSKKLNMLSTLYIVVAIFVLVLSVFSVTFAWYIKSSTQYINNITFAKPVVVEMTSDMKMSEVAVGTPDAVMPGDELMVNIGVKMAENSSRAYVRAKLEVVFDDVYDENNLPVSWDGLIEGFSEGAVDQSVVDPSWIKVNFSRNPADPDWWYVLRLSVATTTSSRQLAPGEESTFINNGQIKVSVNMDNRFAQKSIKFLFTVETIQVEGVDDPLSGGVNNAKYHAQWGRD